MSGFESYEPDALRIPNRGEFGQQLAAAFGKLRDEEIALCRVALLSRLPSRCPPDALDTVGRILQIERYPGEDDETYRGRLTVAWLTWEKAGSDEGIEEQIRAAFGCDVRVFADFEGAFWPPGGWYTRFRVRVGPNLGTLSTTSFIIGAGVIGSTPIGGPHLVATQRRLMKRVIKKWKSTHGYAVDVLVWVSGGPPIGTGSIGSMVIGGESEQIWIGRLVGKNVVIGSTPIGGYDLT